MDLQEPTKAKIAEGEVIAGDKIVAGLAVIGVDYGKAFRVYARDNNLEVLGPVPPRAPQNYPELLNYWPLFQNIVAVVMYMFFPPLRQRLYIITLSKISAITGATYTEDGSFAVKAEIYGTATPRAFKVFDGFAGTVGLDCRRKLVDCPDASPLSKPIQYHSCSLL